MQPSMQFGPLTVEQCADAPFPADRDAWWSAAQVDAWLVTTASGGSDAEAALTGEEIARADRFRFECDRRRFVVSRAAVRQVLGRYAGVAPAEVRFRVGDHGKPALAAPQRPELAFNVSHSKSLALIAVAHGTEVGADVEWVRSGVEAMEIADRYFPDRETCWLRIHAAEGRLEAFYRLWVMKEAAMKADGRGLSMRLNEIDLDAGGPRPVQWSGWKIHELEVPSGYCAAVAVRSAHAAIRRVVQVATRCGVAEVDATSSPDAP